MKIIRSLGTTNIIEINFIHNDGLECMNKIEELIQHFHSLWSIYEDSLISKINHTHDFVLVDDDTLDIIQKSIKYSKNTNGLFDITMGVLSQIWKDSIKKNGSVSKHIIKRELNYVGYQKIVVQNHMIQLAPHQQIDLGGIAKGYILDKIAQLLDHSSAHSGVVNLGGSIYVIGSSNVEIRNPFHPFNDSFKGHHGLKLHLESEMIVTSGIYEQKSVHEHYSHIINPVTGYPCEGDLVSVSLIGKEGAKLDAYATAIFNMTIDDALKLLSEEHIEAVFILKDGSIFATDNIKNKIVKE